MCFHSNFSWMCHVFHCIHKFFEFCFWEEFSFHHQQQLHIQNQQCKVFLCFSASVCGSHNANSLFVTSHQLYMYISFGCFPFITIRCTLNFRFDRICHLTRKNLECINETCWKNKQKWKIFWKNNLNIQTNSTGKFVWHWNERIWSTITQFQCIKWQLLISFSLLFGLTKKEGKKPSLITDAVDGENEASNYSTMKQPCDRGRINNISSNWFIYFIMTFWKAIFLSIWMDHAFSKNLFKERGHEYNFQVPWRDIVKNSTWNKMH